MQQREITIQYLRDDHRENPRSDRIQSGRSGAAVAAWRLQSDLPINATTHAAYRGINILSLWVSALERGYEFGELATLKQWNAIGAHVRKGERASPIVFYREFEVRNDAAQRANSAGDGSEGETERRRMARGYWVFAAEQVDGYTPATALPPNPIQRIAAAEAYFAATGAKRDRRRHAGLLPPIDRHHPHARRGSIHR